jgi:hypothetical protein
MPLRVQQKKSEDLDGEAGKTALSASPMKSKLNKPEWEALLARLSAGKIHDSEISAAIVHLSKPLEPGRIRTVKETILRHLHHQNTWARHEAMWFIRWAGLREENAALVKALRDDLDPDNRGYAAVCIANLMRGTADTASVNALKTPVLDEKEEDAVRTDSYAALLEVVTNESGSDFYIGKKNLTDIEWQWVSTLK